MKVLCQGKLNAAVGGECNSAGFWKEAEINSNRKVKQKEGAVREAGKR